MKEEISLMNGIISILIIAAIIFVAFVMNRNEDRTSKKRRNKKSSEDTVYMSSGKTKLTSAIDTIKRNIRF